MFVLHSCFALLCSRFGCRCETISGFPRHVMMVETSGNVIMLMAARCLQSAVEMITLAILFVLISGC